MYQYMYVISMLYEYMCVCIVCMYIDVYVSMYTCMYQCMYVINMLYGYMYVCIVCVYIDVIDVGVCMCVRMYVSMELFVCNMCVCACICMCRRM
jgi:hypothetical protein